MEETTTTTTMEPIYFPKLNSNKSNIKTIALVALAVLLVVLAVVISIKKDKMTESPFIKAQIDSLARANDSLRLKQAKLDSVASQYQVQIDDLDWKVQNVGEKKTIIREYYHDRVKEPTNYTPHQLDSFFKKRYEY